MRGLALFGSSSVLLVSLLVSSSASAQQIRNYSSQAEATYGGGSSGTAVDAPAGATAAADGGGTASQQSAGGGEGEGGVSLESHVTVFRGGGASAPLPVDLTPEKMYRGIIPGTRDEVLHLTKAREQSGSNQIVWVGFQPRDNSTRVFFQTTQNADYSVGEDNGMITVTFSGTKLAAGNFARFIDTSFFNRNVTRIEVEKVDRSTVVAKISLRSFARPDVDRSGGYITLDFAHSESSSSSGE